MQEFKDRDDFKEGAKCLDGLTSICQVAEKQYLMFFKKYEISRKEIVVILRIYNGSKIWMEKIDRGIIDEMKKKCDIQGSYYSFCELLKSSVENNKYELIQSENDLSVLFQFQLSNYIHLKGTLEMKQGVPIKDDKDILKLLKGFAFDLYDNLKTFQIIYTATKDEPKLNKKKLKDKVVDIEKRFQKKVPPPKKDLLTLGEEVFLGEEPPRVKNRQNLIMPTQKKRKLNGAKIE